MFYTYMWLRENGTPYYVGKGSGKRAFYKHRRTSNPPFDKSLILTQEYPTEQDAFYAEKFLIAYYGRKDLGTGMLMNLTDGGDAPPIRLGKRSEETSEKISKALVGRHLSSAHRYKVLKNLEKTRGHRKGKKHSEEAKEKMSASHKASMSEERKCAMSLAKRKSMEGKPNSFLGKTHSSGTRKRISETKKKQLQDPILREKLSKATKGKPWSEARRRAQENKKYVNA